MTMMTLKPLVAFEHHSGLRIRLLLSILVEELVHGLGPFGHCMLRQLARQEEPHRGLHLSPRQGPSRHHAQQPCGLASFRAA